MQVTHEKPSIAFTLPLRNQPPIDCDFLDDNFVGDPMTVIEFEDESYLCIIHTEDDIPPEEQFYYAIHNPKVYDKPILELLFPDAEKESFIKVLTNHIDEYTRKNVTTCK